MVIANYQEEELEEIAIKLVSNFGHIKVWTFYGDMGAGKTTLIKQICCKMGVSEEMSSPTFSVINEYETTQEGRVFHMDCYRLKDLEEAMDIGVEDYLYSKNPCFIEWPQILESLLTDPTLEISIKLVNEKSRSLTAMIK